MGWKIVHLTRAVKIKVKNDNLRLNFKDSSEEIRIVIKDIDFILFDSMQFSITAKAIHLIAKNNIATLFIDNIWTPSAILIPYHQHSTMTHTAHIQISTTKEFRDNIWQDIVKSKINNQAYVLEILKIKAYKKLQIISQNVQPYDNNNDEAQSARLYWKNIFNDKNFKRQDSKLKNKDIKNAMLNYGYAIIRATMARSVSASGLMPVFGIWHQNKYNAFNLVDDLIEPFRAFVDIHIKTILKKYPKIKLIDTNIKREIISILNIEYVDIKDGTSNISKAIELFVAHYKRAITNNNSALMIYPNINKKYFNNEFI